MGRKGFTLIELLIVIAIIGILVAAIAPRYVGFTEDAEKAATQSNLSSLRGAITLYRGKKGSYPGSNLSGLTTTYIQKIPENKLNTPATNSVGSNCNSSDGWAYNSGDGSINACNGTTMLDW